ncbi:MAG: response regulator [Propioniciclava sp.]
MADDDPAVRDAYRRFLTDMDGSAHQEFTLVGEARNGAQAIECYRNLLPDIVLMDLHMPGTSGVEATERITSEWSDACVVALTTFGTRDYIVAALHAGASGYLLKDSGGKHIVAGMRLALRGDMPLSSAVRRQLVSSVTSSDPPPQLPTNIGLTPRERELLSWLTHGLTNNQIARKMYVSEGSVKQYMSHIGTKLRVKSRTQILIRAIQLNIVDPHTLPTTTTGARS